MLVIDMTYFKKCIQNKNLNAFIDKSNGFSSDP